MDVHALQQLIEHIMDPLMAFASTVGPAAIAKIGEGAATKAGEELIEQGKQLIPVIRNRFAQEQQSDQQNTALLALDGFLADPGTFRPALENKLYTILLSDPAFFATLRQLMHQGTVQQIVADQASEVTENTLIDKTRSANQSIQANNKSKVSKNIMQAE